MVKTVLPLQGPQVQSRIGELRSCMYMGWQKKKKEYSYIELKSSSQFFFFNEPLTFTEPLLCASHYLSESSVK